MVKPGSAPENVVVFLFLSLFMGIVVTFSLTRILPTLPYTVVVFALGILFAFLLTGEHTNNALSASLQLWNSINPDLIFYLFLPPLIFGEAMNLNFYHIRGVSLGAILLAGPGSIIETFGVAIIVFYLLPYKWSWIVCLLFGSIISATDPVAVISVLKKNGVSNRLQYLIVGESLLNDGAALALFIMFSDWIRRDESSWSVMRIVIYFVKFVFLSPLLGVAFGLTTLFCMSIANKRMLPEDNVIQISLTICCAYLSFYVAQHTLDISGALACCVAGLVLAKFANPLIMQVESMRSVWEVLEWTGNTLIFILAGLIIGTGTISFLRAYDLVFIVLAYLIVMLVRGAIIILFFPILTSTGKGLNVREAVFMAYGGLRGAVSVALALSLVHSTTSGITTIDLVVARTVFFMSGGVAALTLLINATTAGMVLKCLKLLPNASVTSEVRIMRQYVMKRIRLKALVLLEQLQEKYPDNVDPQVVWQYCSIFHDSEQLPVNLREVEGENELVIAKNNNKESSNFFIRIFKAGYWMMKSCCKPSSDASHGSHGTPNNHIHPYLHFPFPNLEHNRPKPRLPPSFLHSAIASSKFPSEHRVSANVTYEDIVGQKLEHIAQVALPEEYSRMFLARRRPIAIGEAKVTEDTETQKWQSLFHRFELAELEEKEEQQVNEHMILEDIEVQEVKSEDGALVKEDDIIISGNNFTGYPISQFQQHGGSSKLHRHRPSLFGASEISRSNSSSHIPKYTDVERQAKIHPIVDNSKFSLPATQLAHITQSSSSIIPPSMSPQQPVFLPIATNTPEKQNVLTQIRRAFLEIVRVHYWRQIHSGRLPRKSQSIVILLNSIDYALELSHTSGLDDWAYISQLHSYLFWDLPAMSSTDKQCLEKLEMGDMHEMKDNSTTSNFCRSPRFEGNFEKPFTVDQHLSDDQTIRIGRQVHFDSVSNIYSGSSFVPAHSDQREEKPRFKHRNRTSRDNNNTTYMQRNVSNNSEIDNLGGFFQRILPRESHSLMEYRHAQVVYLLVAFLEAHEYAQTKIRFYIGDSEGVPISDEDVVIEESRLLVNHAKRVLSCIDQNVVTQQLSKQAARWILHVQEDAIMEFREEGVITGTDAEAMLQEIEIDRKKLSSQYEKGTSESIATSEDKELSYACPWFIQCTLLCSSWFHKAMFFVSNALYGTLMYCQRRCQ